MSPFVRIYLGGQANTVHVNQIASHVGWSRMGFAVTLIDGRQGFCFDSQMVLKIKAFT